jgi:hypothetical protein
LKCRQRNEKEQLKILLTDRRQKAKRLKRLLIYDLLLGRLWFVVSGSWFGVALRGCKISDL